MAVSLYGEPGGTGKVLATVTETGVPAGAPCWTASVVNDDDSKSVFLTTQIEGHAVFREYHGAGTFDLPAPQPITLVTIKDRTLYES
ncbi:hypothetical protein [Bailinhaonella thermotolerans]|uniref:Uncharacterized protein n=1 Tax=Bailinhaonella thermotolerans TaxID=1070861 RepID=A0A3A4AYT0_9ACTN|nr:hypothetical protein [Bailinhaonella thermotolerans]RJL31003.1 hypothetical protein D5H75_22250 [Bailinhaonella thermotolerans]